VSSATLFIAGLTDGLVAVFFFVVGLEIKREMLISELADRRLINRKYYAFFRAYCIVKKNLNIKTFSWCFRMLLKPIRHKSVSYLATIMALLLAVSVFRGETVFAKATGLAKNTKNIASHSLDVMPAQLSAKEEAEVDKMALPIPPNWIGDFDGMKERHYIRMLVPLSKTFFFIDRGQQAGADYEYGKALEKWLNTVHPTKNKSQQWKVLFIPVRRDQLLPDLIAGKGDIAGGGLTITKARRELVDFSSPFASGVREALVTGPEGPKIGSLDDLSGKEVAVRASSSYFEHLQNLNIKLKKKGLQPVNIIALDEWLESEDILEMVNAGLIKMTFVDRYLAQIWKPLYKKLQIHDTIYLNEGGELAWAIRRGSPKFSAELSAFMEKHKVGSIFGNTLVKNYVHNDKRVLNATSAEEMRKFQKLVGFFKKYGNDYDFEYLLLMAQGFQESRLDQQARSTRGAVGVMQLLPSTATDPAVGIRGVDADAEKNIQAGAKYLRLLSDKYLTDKALTPINRTLMAFAAYNAGPGNLLKFRRLAEKSGNDPNVWFQNVEYAAARIVGQETTNYVSNIYKYYLAYKLVDNRGKGINKVISQK
jgi:membrane-bound lytic murein transglycosylase MltF